MFVITRQDIEHSEYGTIHRVIVYEITNDKRMVSHIADSLDPNLAYRSARRAAGIKGKVPVEWINGKQPKF